MLLVRAGDGGDRPGKVGKREREEEGGKEDDVSHGSPAANLFAHPYDEVSLKDEAVLKDEDDEAPLKDSYSEVSLKEPPNELSFNDPYSKVSLKDVVSHNVSDPEVSRLLAGIKISVSEPRGYGDSRQSMKTSRGGKGTDGSRYPILGKFFFNYYF